MNSFYIKLFLKIFVTVIVVWALFFGAVLPQFHNFSNVDEIIIRVRPRNETNWPSESYKTSTESGIFIYEKHITDKQTIKEIEKSLGVTWDGPIPLHSYETGTTHYSLKIIRNNKSIQSFSFSEREWGNAGKSPKRTKDYIRQLMK